MTRPTRTRSSRASTVTSPAGCVITRAATAAAWPCSKRRSASSAAPPSRPGREQARLLARLLKSPSSEPPATAYPLWGVEAESILHVPAVGSEPLPSRVIGVAASAGGVEALRKLVAALPAELDAAVCVVLHI